tara:strand:- start:9632 stop:9955 length:324 start_codon:yes stop_codon:yes gene_type:complete
MEKNSITYEACDTGETITTEKKYTKLPYKLDEITIGSTSEKIVNPFSGESYELDAVEEAVYSVIKGAEWSLNMDSSPVPNSLAQTMFQDGMDWFRINNARAYMTLLD